MLNTAEELQNLRKVLQNTAKLNRISSNYLHLRVDDIYFYIKLSENYLAGYFVVLCIIYLYMWVYVSIADRQTVDAAFSYRLIMIILCFLI